jgi:nucleoid DNA-binding protein
MTKKQLIRRVSEKLGNIPQKEAEKTIEAVFESIAEGLQKDGTVNVGKWGTYTAEDIADS